MIVPIRIEDQISRIDQTQSRGRDTMPDLGPRVCV
jgi:hypothetical protein